MCVDGMSPCREREGGNGWGIPLFLPYYHGLLHSLTRGGTWMMMLVMLVYLAFLFLVPFQVKDHIHHPI